MSTDGGGSSNSSMPSSPNAAPINGSGIHRPPLSAFSQVLVPIIYTTELLVYLPTVPLVFFCAYLVLRTSVLHRNLKWILLALYLQVLGFAFSRIYWLLGTFFTDHLPMPTYYVALGFGLIVFGNLVGHALIIERILATIWVLKYESYQGIGFTIAWILLTTSLSFANAYYQSYVIGSMMVISKITLYTHVFAMLASLAEIFIISLVTYLNVKGFRLDERAPTVHPLTVRYQLTENIRTGKLLAPTFVCHFISVTISFLIITNTYCHCITDFEALMLLITIAYLLHSLNNFTLLFTLILFHPILNRSARKVLKRWRKVLAKLRLPGASNGPVPSNRVVPSHSIHTIDVCPLPVDANGFTVRQAAKRKSQGLEPGDNYFRQLHRAWGDYLH